MSRTLDDALARRTRALMLNARASVEIAPRIAALLAAELGLLAGDEPARSRRFLAPRVLVLLVAPKLKR